MISVSYTHLDVYKRQKHSRYGENDEIHELLFSIYDWIICLFSSKWCRTIYHHFYSLWCDSSIYSESHIGKCQTRNHLQKKIIYPVSYTHLDVYKRQVREVFQSYALIRKRNFHERHASSGSEAFLFLFYVVKNHKMIGVL